MKFSNYNLPYIHLYGEGSTLILRQIAIFKPGTLQPEHVWFLKIVSVQMSVYVRVCVFVCPPPRLLITSSVIWTPYEWLKKFYSCYMATVVIIINGRGLGIGTHGRH